MTETDATFAALLDRAITEPGVIMAAYHAFHNYSLGNQLLAWVQCLERGLPLGPLATFPGWMAKGRPVQKGSKALSLWQPITVKTKGNPEDPTDEGARFTRFRLRAAWFVLAQTAGADVTPDPLPTWDADRACQALGVARIPFASLDGNTQGYAQGRAIAINPVAGLPLKTLCHELAHILLGHTEAGDETARGLREVEAEAVALCCLAALDLPGQAECRGYIQRWNQGGGAIPEKSAQKIMKVAGQILTAGQATPEQDIATEVDRAIATETGGDL